MLSQKIIIEKDPEEIVSLQTVKDFLNVFNDTHDDLIKKLTTSARKTVENILNIALNNDIIEYKTNNFTNISCHSLVELPDTPVQKILSIEHKSEKIEDFSLTNNGIKSVLQIPFLNIGLDENLKIKYVRGPNKKEINESIKLATLMLIKDLFTERSTKSSSMNNIKQLLTPFINFNI